jgi:hypothetical protein
MTQPCEQQFTGNPWYLTLAACHRLCDFMDSLGITPGHLARLMNAPDTLIEKIEQGKFIIPIDWIIQLLALSGIDPDWLITGDAPLTEKKPLAHGELIKLMAVPEVRISILDELKKAKKALKSKIQENVTKKRKKNEFKKRRDPQGCTRRKKNKRNARTKNGRKS